MEAGNATVRRRHQWVLWTLFVISTLVLPVALLALFITLALPGAENPTAPDTQRADVPWTLVATVVASLVTSLATLTGIVTGWRKQKLDSIRSELDLQKMQIDLERSRLELEQLKSGSAP